MDAITGQRSWWINTYAVGDAIRTGATGPVVRAELRWRVSAS
jgi:hypothetical protein